jgi:hypothetical protein
VIEPVVVLAGVPVARQVSAQPSK